MLKIRLTKNQQEYDAGQNCIALESRSFLQSFEYGEMQGKMGNEPVYMLIEDQDDQIVGSMLAILFKARRGRYLFMPYPVMDKKIMEVILPHLRALAGTLKIDFLRISPMIDESAENKKWMADMGFRDAPVHMMHPELLWLLDLNKTEEELLKDMRKNTRYGVKQAEKMGLEVKSGATEELLKQFYEIHEETSKRQHFIPYPWAYLKAQLEVFAPKDQIKIYIVENEGKPIAGAVIMFFGPEGIYHHGASLSEFNKIPSSYLIQWEAIKETKKRGMPRYNFWGVVDNAPKHPWAGLSFFKKGFGGYGRPILHCQDLPLTPKYWFNFVIETIRRIKRGY